jgi:hypothetical protein
MVATRFSEVNDVVTVNVAVVAPAATVTDAGTEAFELDDVSVTVCPPAGAAPLRVTVPIELAPQTTVLGLRVTEATAGAFVIVSDALAD